MGRQDGEVNLIEVGRGKVREFQQDRSGNHGAGRCRESAVDTQEQQATGWQRPQMGSRIPNHNCVLYNFFN